MLEFINSLQWPGAFAIVGSIVTIVTGLFGYLMQSRKKEKEQQLPTQVDNQQSSEIQRINSDIQKLHDRVSEVKDRAAYLDGDVRELRGYVKSLQKQLTDHEHRDIEDFRAVQAKLDQLMEIVIQILQDDE